MINHDFALGQLVRISRLRNAPDPKTEDGKVQAEEVITALRAVARDEGHAKQIVDEFVRKSIYFPAPAEIYALEQGEIMQPWQQPKTNCDRCGDSGYVSEDRMIDGKSYPFAIPCLCRKAPRSVSVQAPDRRSMSAEPDLARQVASGKVMR